MTGVIAVRVLGLVAVIASKLEQGTGRVVLKRLFVWCLLSPSACVVAVLYGSMLFMTLACIPIGDSVVASRVFLSCLS